MSNESINYQELVNILRKDMSDMERRLTSVEVNCSHQKQCVEDLKADLRMMQGNIKVDLERIQVSLHKDIRVIQETLNDIVKRQAIEEARFSTGITVGKFVADKMPWLITAGATLAALVQFGKDKAP